MTLRLIEVYGVKADKEEFKKILEDITIYGIWQDVVTKDETVTNILVASEQTEPALNTIEEKYSNQNGFHIIVFPIVASIPRPEKEEIKKDEQKTGERICLEEIYQNLSEKVSFSKTFFVLIILASIVAAIGIYYDNVAVVIGSMVIAPLLSPSIALSLSFTLADFDLTKDAAKSAVIGYSAPLIIGIIFGVFLKVEFSSSNILITGTNIDIMYILLALSAGIAGTLSFTRDVSQALVGVMVAVALLPPLVTSGLLIGSNYWHEAQGALLLFFVNLVSINLAGIVTFLVQGVTPREWWEKEKAKKTVKKAIILWIIMLLLLAFMIYIYKYPLELF
jgi:uncharacterized hydrophobic protein (TIGR00341 family)